MFDGRLPLPYLTSELNVELEAGLKSIWAGKSKEGAIRIFPA